MRRLALFLLLSSVSGFAQGSITNIFIFIQENRTLDQYFGCHQGVAGTQWGLSNCSTTPTGKCNTGLPGCSTGTINLTRGTPGATTECASNDCPHSRQALIASVDAGAMDGFGGTCSLSGHPNVQCWNGNSCASGNCDMAGYEYFLPQDLPRYDQLATTFTLLANFYPRQNSPSYPGHMFLVAGQTGNELANNTTPLNSPPDWTCDAQLANANGQTPSCTGVVGGCTGSQVYAQNGLSQALLNETVLGVSLNKGDYYFGGVLASDSATACVCDTGASLTNPLSCSGPGGTCNTNGISRGGNKGAQCFDVTTLGDKFDAANISWRVYGPTSSVQGYWWFWPAYYPHLRFGPDWSTSRIAQAADPGPLLDADVAANTVAAVSWLIPPIVVSEHPPNGVSAGESWIMKRIQAIWNNSALWNHSLILLIWDDGGGFYDHVNPPTVDLTGNGVRVPGLIISPYSVTGINTTQLDFASILRCIEDRTLGTSSFLTAADQTATSACGAGIINLAQSPIQPPSTAPATVMLASTRSDTDVETLALRAWRHFFKREREERTIAKLKMRECDQGLIAGQVRYHGEILEVCHNPLTADGQPILFRGQKAGDDDDDLDDRGKD